MMIEAYDIAYTYYVTRIIITSNFLLPFRTLLSSFYAIILSAMPKQP